MANQDERRGKGDRRRSKQGTWSGTERRWRKERRHIFVEELELSEGDWNILFGCSRKKVLPQGF